MQRWCFLAFALMCFNPVLFVIVAPGDTPSLSSVFSSLLKLWVLGGTGIGLFLVCSRIKMNRSHRRGDESVAEIHLKYS